MTGVLFLLLLYQIESVNLADTVSIVYDTPIGYSLCEVESTDYFKILTQENSEITLIVLALDTIPLPILPAVNNTGDTIFIDPPVLVVERIRSDSTFTVKPFPGPAVVYIPPGLPEDYLRQLLFWYEWGTAPGFPWLWISLFTALSGLGILVLHKLKRKQKTAELLHSPVDLTGEGNFRKRILELLESKSFAEGNWKVLYARLDDMLRSFITSRFSIKTFALTHRQIREHLEKSTNRKQYCLKINEMMKEIQLQRYAGWGSTREKAEVFIKSFADQVGKWKT